MRNTAITTCLALLVLGPVGCLDQSTSPLEPAAESSSLSARGHGPASARVVGSLLRVPHTWPIVNWSSIRALNATLDADGDPHGSYKLDIEVDFGDGPFLQQTTEKIICLEVAERADGQTTDIWMSTKAKGWVTVPPGVTHYAITHMVDSPDGDRLAARSIISHPPAEYCKTRPDLSDPGPNEPPATELLPAESGNIVSLRR